MKTKPTSSDSVHPPVIHSGASTGGLSRGIFAPMSISKRSRFKVFDRDDYTCRYCGKTPADGITLEADHVMPKSKGGGDSMENLVTSCFDCNRGKSNLDIGANHEEPPKVAMKRIQEIMESKRLIAEKRKAEKLREKQIQGWVNTVCDAFKTERCPKRIAMDCARHAKEFGAKAVLDWIDRISMKFNEPDSNANKYLNGIARRTRGEDN